MSWQTPQDPKFNRLLIFYCILTTLFCFHFIHLATLNSDLCQSMTEPKLEITVNATNVTSKPQPQDFPRKIWQTAKTSAAGLGDEERKSIQTWITLNQKHRYEVVTKHSAETYVLQNYMHKPDIAETFLDLQDNMMRADLVKYLTLSGEGGVYCDLDTVLLKPIDDWIPRKFKDQANLVIGVEYDVLDGSRWSDWTLDLQFASWAILAKPGHLAFDIALERATSRLRKLAREQHKSVSDMKASYKEVLDSTGPALFTNSVMDAISRQTETKFTWKNITNLKEPRLISDVLVLPIDAFGSDQRHSNSGSSESESALVKHLFAGSWKGDHPFKDQMEKEEKKEEKKGDKKEVKKQS